MQAVKRCFHLQEALAHTLQGSVLAAFLCVSGLWAEASEQRPQHS